MRSQPSFLAVLAVVVLCGLAIVGAVSLVLFVEHVVLGL